MVQPIDAQQTQTPSSIPLQKKDAGQCAALRHLRKDTDREKICLHPTTYAPFSQTIIKEGYSLCKRYNESRKPLQDCRCEKDRGETAVVAILLLLSSPLVQAVSLHN